MSAHNREFIPQVQRTLQSGQRGGSPSVTNRRQASGDHNLVVAITRGMVGVLHVDGEHPPGHNPLRGRDRVFSRILEKCRVVLLACYRTSGSHGGPEIASYAIGK